MVSIRSSLNPQHAYLVSSNLVPVMIRTALPPMYRKCPFFFFYASSLIHSMDSTMNAIEYFSAYNSPQSLKLASVTPCCLLYLQHKFWLKTVSFVAAEISTRQTYQLFFPYISWDKYYHTPILLMVVLSSKRPS